MAGVREINDSPLRYLVTFTHTQHLDNSQFSVVEQRFDVTDSQHYFFCRKHRSIACECVASVNGYREAAGLNEPDKKDWRE